MPEDSWTIFLNGSYGVGKSAVLDHLGDLFAELGRPFSLIDVDWFHRSWPPAVDDPDNVLTEAENLATVWSHYRAAGPRQLCVSGVIRSPEDRERYERVFAMPVRSVRLEASAVITEERLRRRYSADQRLSLEWHLSRYAELARVLAAEDLDECVIRTDDLTPREVARRVLDHLGPRPTGGG